MLVTCLLASFQRPDALIARCVLAFWCLSGMLAAGWRYRQRQHVRKEETAIWFQYAVMAIVLAFLGHQPDEGRWEHGWLTLFAIGSIAASTAGRFIVWHQLVLKDRSKDGANWITPALIILSFLAMSWFVVLTTTQN